MPIKTVGSEKYLVPINDQVCTFIQAVKLRKLGLPQNTYYYYMKYIGVDIPSLTCGNRFPEDQWCKHYAAYTLADLAQIEFGIDNLTVQIANDFISKKGG